MRSFNSAMHYVAGLALVGILALTVADVVGRAILNKTVPGTFELTAAVLVVVVFLGLAHAEDLGDHISVDILYVRVGPRAKAAMNLFAQVLSVFVLALVTRQLVQFAIRQADAGAETPTLEWPIWPFIIISAFGSALYALAVLNKIVLTALREPPELEHEGMALEAEELVPEEEDEP